MHDTISNEKIEYLTNGLTVANLNCYFVNKKNKEKQQQIDLTWQGVGLKKHKLQVLLI